MQLRYMKNSMWDICEKLYLLKKKIKKFYCEFYPYYKQKFLYPKAVFLVLTPEHGNLGDHAIAYAETKMLEKLHIKYIEITGEEIKKLYKKKCLHFMNGRTILITGGGNLGTLWYEVEQLQRAIIQENPKSNIIVLPNTLYYEASEWGRQEKLKSQDIYNAHNHLYLYAREKNSYKKMKELYKNVKLVPDMVFSLNESKEQRERAGCLLCMRSDCEKTISSDERVELNRQIKSLFEEKIIEKDMCVDYVIKKENRKVELNKQFELFRSVELVVTDRLHGMIFATITGTPCILLNSKSPKVKGCYEWVKDLTYVQFVEDVSEITEKYKAIDKENCRYDNRIFEKYYDILLKDVLEGCM